MPAPLHVALIGPIGCGKHTTTKIIGQIISSSFPNIKFKFYDFHKFDYMEARELSDEEFKTIDNDYLDVRIISCDIQTVPHLVRKIKKYINNTKLILSIWHLYEYSLRPDLLINKEIFFRNYNKIDLMEIFERRIEKYLLKSNASSEYFKGLKERVLPALAGFSEGNLRIAFKIFKGMHQEARIKGLKTIERDFLESVLDRLNNLKEQKITEKENEIVRFCLLNGVKFATTPLLVEEMELERTVAWKYLEKLCKKGAFYKIPGNPSQYGINELFLSFYEEKIKKEIIFKES